MEPAGFQLLPVEVDGPDIGEGIVASAEDAAGITVRTVEIGGGSEVTLTAVAIVALIILAAAVVPIEGACRLAQFGFGIAGGVVGNRVDGGTCLSIEYSQVLMTTVNATCTCAMVLCIVGSLDLLVGGSLVHIVALAIFGAGGRLAHQFGLAVTVVVVDLELGVVGASTDVHA